MDQYPFVLIHVEVVFQNIWLNNKTILVFHFGTASQKKRYDKIFFFELVKQYIKTVS